MNMITTCPNCGLPSHDGAEILRCPKCGYTKEFMDCAEFASLIGTSISTLYRWDKEGRVKSTHFGPRLIRYHRSEYERLAGLVPNETGEKI